jgi:signal peptidase I
MNNENQTPTTPLPDSPLGSAGETAQTQPQPHPLDTPAPQAPPAQQPPTPAPEPQSDAPSPIQPEAPSSPLASIARSFSSIFGAIFSWIIFPVAVVLILHNFVFQAYHVLGTSMVPTLHDTDYLIISKLGYTQALVERTLNKNKVYIPARGQIIVFHYPKDTTKIFVKRVVGLPGDHIVIKNGTVTVSNTQHPEGFSPDTNYEPKDTATLIDTDEVVQQGNVFVMGDNRTPGGSYDSREWGELPSSYIIGNAVLRLLPLDQIKVF